MNKREMNSDRIQEVYRLIEAESNIIIRRYVSIGKLYDLKYSEQAEDDFLPLINTIRDSEDKIKEYEEELLVLRGMVRCTACGAEVEEENTFCTKCGARIKEEPEPAPVSGVRICPSCNKVFDDGESLFCHLCGTKLEQYNDSVEKEQSKQRTCPKCGFTTDNMDYDFCICCGTRMTE